MSPGSFPSKILCIIFLNRRFLTDHDGIPSERLGRGQAPGVPGCRAASRSLVEGHGWLRAHHASPRADGGDHGNRRYRSCCPCRRIRTYKGFAETRRTGHALVVGGLRQGGPGRVLRRTPRRSCNRFINPRRYGHRHLSAGVAYHSASIVGPDSTSDPYWSRVG